MKKNESNVILGSMDSGKKIEWEPWHLRKNDMRVFSVIDFRFEPLITYFVYQVRCAWWSMDYWVSRSTAVSMGKWYLSEANALRAAIECYNRPDDWHLPDANPDKNIVSERDAIVAAVVLDSIQASSTRSRGAR